MRLKKKVRLKRPAELLGYRLEDERAKSAALKREMICRFTRENCIKKTHYAKESGKRASSGICSVWYNGLPHITCSKRQLQNDLIFRRTSELILETTDYVLFPERSLGRYGRIDFIVAKYDRSQARILDFFGLEIVSIDTTSTRGLNEAISDRLKGKLKKDYVFGLNFAHTVKLMITQLILKGSITEKWNKKYVWVIQDVLFKYLQSLTGFSATDGIGENSIVFYLTSMAFDESKQCFVIEEVGVKSTTVSEFKRKVRIVENQIPKFDRFLGPLNKGLKEKLRNKEQTKLLTSL